MTRPGSFRLFGSLGSSGADFNWVSKTRASNSIYVESFFGANQISGNTARTFVPLNATARGTVTGVAGVLTRIYLDPAALGQSGTWQQPADCPEFSVEVISAGGFHNPDGTATGNRWGGGAGGNYVLKNRVGTIPGTIFNFTAGMGGSGLPVTLSKQDGTVLIKGSAGGDAIGLAGGLPSTDNIGDLIILGGQGGTSQAGSGAGGGGGGSAGPNGPGGKGGASHSSGARGGGGGAANGGGDGTNATSGFTGAGGIARDGSAGGTATGSIQAQNGSGGGGTINATAAQFFQPGSMDPVWSSNYGPGSGGGGVGYGYSLSNIGFGGGAPGNAISPTDAGRSLIVITYYARAAGIAGRLNASLAPAGSVSVAKLQLKATSSRTFSSMTAISAAKNVDTARVSATFMSMTGSAAAKLQIKAAVACTFSALVSAGHGGTTMGASLTRTLGALTGVITGVSPKRAALTRTFVALTGVSSAKLPDTGSLVQLLGPATVFSTARLQLRGTSNAAFSPLSTNARGILWITAKGAATFLPLAGFAKARGGDPPYPPASRTIVVRHPSRIVVAYHPPRVVKA